MCRKPCRAKVRLISGLLMLALKIVQAHEAIHNVENILFFDSTESIKRYFRTNVLSFDVFPLERYGSNNFVLAAYPYSGLKKIDIYSFARSGNTWGCQMLFFIFEPSTRTLGVRETAKRIEVW